MKRFLSLILALMIAPMLLTACNSTPSKSSEGSKLKVVSTIFPQYDFVREIAGDKVELSMLLRPGAESHSFEPTPKDISAVENADLFIYVGGHDDAWVEDLLENSEKKPSAIKLTDLVTTVEEEIVEGMEHEHEHENADHEHEHEDADHEHEHEHEDADHEHEHEDADHEHEHEDADHEHEHEDHEHEIDEHVWTSPKNAIKIVESITEKLVEKDPKNADTYKKNSAAYIKKLNDLDSEIKAVVKDGKRKTLVFADRFPFRYFTNEYGLDYYAAFSGCSTQTDPSAGTVAFLLDRVKEESIPVVFVIELSSGKIADTITEATGAKKLTLYSCHNVSKDDFEAGASYLSMMKENVKSLKTALN